MKAITYSLLLSAAVMSVGCSSVDSERLPEIASNTDYGKGVSAPYCGTAENVLIMAGGANFPDVPAADGGEKCYYDEIWGLTSGSSEWLLIGKLPCPSAYGASYDLGDRIVMAGGANSGGSHSFVRSLSISDCQGSLKSLPDLPVQVEQAAAASSEGRLFLAGGLCGRRPQTGVFCCDTISFEWTRIAELPEPLVQPVAMVHCGTLYVWGGYNPVKNCAIDYGYAYDISSWNWRRIAGVPDGGTLTGSASAIMPDGRLAVCGGVDIDVFNNALSLPAEKKKDYMSLPPESYRFRREILVYDPVSSVWETVYSSAYAARAGAGIVSVQGGLAILNGELKPGIRTSGNRFVKKADFQSISNLHQ